MSKSPGIGYGEYYKLSEVIENKILSTKHVVFEFKNNSVFSDGKPIQGLRIVGDYAQIKGVHYTSWENATQIRSMIRLESFPQDPFVYLAPKGAMQGWPEKLICKELGASSANTEVVLEVVVPVDIVWIKASRNVIHFAIEGSLAEEEIVNINIQRRKQDS